MDIIIIGAGISGLTLAYALKSQSKNITIEILEADSRPGGKIYTEHLNGYVCEAGVNGFLDNKPATLTLASELNLKPLRSSDEARRRFIYFDDKLRLIPTSPPAFMLSNFLSLRGRLRMLGEYFVPKANLEDESLKDFALRRVGREFFDKLLDPMASGVYAGDPAKLSIRSCFKKVYELEQNYGSLIKGFIAIAKENKKAGTKTEAGPSGILHSFSNGMFSLIECLKDRLQSELKLSKAVTSITKTPSGFKVFTSEGELNADIVVSACPAYTASEICKDIDPELSKLLRQIPYPPLSVVALGFDRRDIKNVDLNGFGFLVPAVAKRKILGCLFDSSIFSGRAPEGKVLLRAMLGGARYPELAELDEATLVETVLKELDCILSLKGSPEFVRVYKWHKAIPQYNLGHHTLLRDIESLLSKHKGLYLTGNAFRGVAVNDCIANSFELSKVILTQSKP